MPVAAGASNEAPHVEESTFSIRLRQFDLERGRKDRGIVRPLDLKITGQTAFEPSQGV